MTVARHQYTLPSLRFLKLYDGSTSRHFQSGASAYASMQTCRSPFFSMLTRSVLKWIWHPVHDLGDAREAVVQLAQTLVRQGLELLAHDLHLATQQGIDRILQSTRLPTIDPIIEPTAQPRALVERRGTNQGRNHQHRSGPPHRHLPDVRAAAAAFIIRPVRDQWRIDPCLWHSSARIGNSTGAQLT